MITRMTTSLSALILRRRGAPSRRPQVGYSRLAHLHADLGYTRDRSAAPCFETRPSGAPQHEAGIGIRLGTAAALAVAALIPSAPYARTAPTFAIDASWPKDLPKDWITGQ